MSEIVEQLKKYMGGGETNWGKDAPRRPQTPCGELVTGEVPGFLQHGWQGLLVDIVVCRPSPACGHKMYIGLQSYGYVSFTVRKLII